MISEYFANGYQDFWDGHDDSPHAPGTAAHEDWNEGWSTAERDCDNYLR